MSQPALVTKRLMCLSAPFRGRALLWALLAGSALLSTARAQGRVQDPEFGKLLENLLSHDVPETSVAEARQQAGILFLDAREIEEYQVSHVPDARWVGYDDFSLERLQGVAKDRPIVVYCSVGYRSERVAEKLIGAGFTRVSNLYGGIFEWANQDCPLENLQGKTRAVHTYSLGWSKWVKAAEKVY